MLELEDYFHLRKLFWYTTVTVIVRIKRLLSFTRTLLEDHCHCHHCHCKNWKTTVIYKNSCGITRSQSSLSLLELEDYSHIQELFWKTTVTVITVIVRIGRLLSITRTLFEDHCHCHHCHCKNWKTTVIYKNSFGRPLSLSSLSLLELEHYCHLQELFWKTTGTVITVIFRLEDYCHLQELF